MIIKSKLKLCLLMSTVLFGAVMMLEKEAHAVAYTWNGSVNNTWENASNWTPGTGPPGSGDSATIDLAAANVTIAGTTTVSKLTIGGINTSTLTLGGNDLNVTYVDVTYNGDLTIGTNGTLDASTGTPIITVAGSWDSSGGTFTIGTSTLVMTGTSNTLTTVDTSIVIFYNLTINAGASITLSSSFAVRGLLAISGTLTVPTGKTLGSSTAPNNLTVNAGGELTGLGTFYKMVFDGKNHITNDGTISINTFEYRLAWGSVAAPVTATTYEGNLVIREYDLNQSSIGLLGGGTGTLVVNGNLTLQHSNSPTYSVTLDSSSLPVDINGDVTIASGGIIDADTSSWTVSGNWVNSDTFTAGTSTVAFNGTVAQAITSGGDSFYDLTISNTSDIVSLADDLSLLAGGALTINAGATLDLNGNNLTVPTTFNNNGTLQLEGGETVSAPVNGSGS
ncbi:MAG: hypothetical protein L0958_03605, partial [Candidatus Mariimomonas ferrooxydans]